MTESVFPGLTHFRPPPATLNTTFGVEKYADPKVANIPESSPGTLFALVANIHPVDPGKAVKGRQWTLTGHPASGRQIFTLQYGAQASLAIAQKPCW